MKQWILIGLFSLAAVTVGCDSNNLDTLESRLLVARNSITSVQLSAPATIIEVGVGRSLSLAGTISNSSVETDLTDSAIWSSSDTAIITVNSNGVVTGVANGIAIITGTVGPLSDSIELRASSAALTEITVLGDSQLADGSTEGSTIDECTSAQFVARGSYFGEEKDRVITELVDWGQSVGNVGVFDTKTIGLLRSNVAGVATVTASLGNIVGTFDVTVLDNLSQIVVSDDGTTLSTRNSIDYTATASYADNTTTADISDNASWSLNASFATVDNTLPDKGLVVATSTGTGTLTVTCGGVPGVLEISSGSATEITELFFDRDSPFRLTFAGLQPLQLGVFTRFENGTNQDVTEDSDWVVVTNTNTQNQLDNRDGSKGEVTIRGAGRLLLEARYTDEDNDPPQTFTSRFEIIIDAP